MALDLAFVNASLSPAPSIWALHAYDSIGSTMDVARQLGVDGAAEGTVVLAEEQTAGRGRMGRRWVSPAGLNLYFTIILRPQQAVLPLLAMLTPLAVAEAIESVAHVRAEIKWPNDVQIGGSKCAGVLIDSEVRASGEIQSLVGVGIDVNFDPSSEPELREIATSISLECGEPVSRERLLAAVLNRFGYWYARSVRSADIWDAWRARLNTIGRAVRVSGPGLSESGRVEDVDEEGSLLLRRDDGRLITVAAGEVSLRAEAQPVPE